ncbi:MAG: hypothetical protein ACYCZX_13575 [Rhodospirillaceae bacterium]
MRRLFSAAAFLVAAGVAPAAFAAAAGVPDKNGIIWDDPKAPPKSPESSETFQAQPAPAARTAPAPVGNLDNAGIVWNAPAKAANRAVPPPRSGADQMSPRATNTAAVSTAGPCHEFQTTILIDGRKQPAHGTVCQQPDGSWHVVDK